MSSHPPGHRAVLLAAMLLSCAPEDEAQTRTDLVLLDGREQLIRLSVDLRGTHPSEAELAAFEAAPETWAQRVDEWIEDPRAADQIVAMVDLRLRLRTGETWEQELEGVSEARVAEALSGEGLGLVRKIWEEQLPWTELVTAEYTVADRVLAELWGLERDPEAVGPTEAFYTDGRPHQGLLTMSSLWLRYPSDGGNANRHRANALNRMLLCDDFLSRPIVLNRAAVDQLTEDPESAIAENPGCQSCHASLDPLSAHLFGFFGDVDSQELNTAVTYRPEAEQGWRDHHGKAPAWYGVPTNGLPELGALMAEDPRFVDCAVQTVWEGLTQREVHEADWTELQEHRAAFVEGELRLQPLVRSILIEPSYRAKGATLPELAERLPGAKLVRPDQLQTILRQKTGVTWELEGEPALTSHSTGIPVLLGGTDGLSVTERAQEAGVAALFVQERLAWTVAWEVVGADLDLIEAVEAGEDTGGEGISGPTLLTQISSSTAPGDAAFDAQVRHLYRHLTGIPLAATTEEAGAPMELALMQELWTDVHDVHGTNEAAWSAVVAAVLRDPRLLVY